MAVVEKTVVSLKTVVLDKYNVYYNITIEGHDRSISARVMSSDKDTQVGHSQYADGSLYITFYEKAKIPFAESAELTMTIVQDMKTQLETSVEVLIVDKE